MSSSHPAAAPSLADFQFGRRVLKVSALAAVAGVLSTLVAKLLMVLIQWLTAVIWYGNWRGLELIPAARQVGWWVLVIPALGGLLVGLMARYGSPQIRGHGIPEALEAILFGGSRMDARVTALKPLSSAVSIGTGGPFGAEGPIIVTGGAVASLFAQRFRLSGAERKTLLVAGAAAGMTAIFGTPVASVLLALEVLLFEWRPRSLVPVATAAAVAAALRLSLFPPGPIFPLAGIEASPGALPLGLLLGLLGGVAAIGLTHAVYAVEDGFERLPVHWMWWPALGGLIVGLGGLLQPQALGVGYDVIEDLVNGRLATGALASLLIVKTVIWVVALGSGTSGGVLAPLLIVGGALGALLAHLMPGASPALAALLGMTAVLAGALRAPLTAVMFAFEATHAVGTLPPLLIGAMAAFAVTAMTLPHSILTAKVARHGHHLSFDLEPDPLGRVRVAEVMDTNPPLVNEQLTVADLTHELASGAEQLTRQGLFVVDDQRRLVGILTRSDLLRAVAPDGTGGVTVGQVCTHAVQSVFPDELVSAAVDIMLGHAIGRLPVVAREDPRQVIGYFGRAEALAARFRSVESDVRPSS